MDITIKNSYLTTMLYIFFIWGVGSVLGFQDPSGTAMADVYTFFINDIIGGFGPIIAILIICYGFYWILRTNVIMVIGCILAAAGINFADEISQAIGAMY